MKAIAVHPGTPDSIHVRDIPEPHVSCLAKAGEVERAEGRWEELGYEPMPYPWHEPPPPPPQDFVMSHHLQPLRLDLGPEEVDRYRRASADAAAAITDVLGGVHPEQRELDVAGALAGR